MHFLFSYFSCFQLLRNIDRWVNVIKGEVLIFASKLAYFCLAFEINTRLVLKSVQIKNQNRGKRDTLFHSIFKGL